MRPRLRHEGHGSVLCGVGVDGVVDFHVSVQFPLLNRCEDGDSAWVRSQLAESWLSAARELFWMGYGRGKVPCDQRS